MSIEARSEVAYRILRETNHRDDLVEEILSQYRDGFKDKDLLERLTDVLANRRVQSCLGPVENLLHLVWGVLPEEGVLDGYLAEYYYDWATKLGIPEEKISNIFLDLQSPGHDS